MIFAHSHKLKFIFHLWPQLHLFGTVWVSAKQSGKALLMQFFWPERDWKLVRCRVVLMTRVGPLWAVSKAFRDNVLRTRIPVCKRRAPRLEPFVVFSFKAIHRLTMNKLTIIPGIGKTLERDFARIGITHIEQLLGADPDALFAQLKLANAAEDHKTSKNYLYVIRMAVYYASGGRDAEKLVWNAWKD